MVKVATFDDLFAQVEKAVEDYQSELTVSKSQEYLLLEGLFVVSGPEGPYDYFEVKIQVFEGFPVVQPIVFEMGKRIPRIVDRHIFPKHGNCCLGIWEEWILLNSDLSFENFLTGILNDYFASQVWYECKEEWPFGERSHDVAGVRESYADILEVQDDNEIIVEYLRLLSQKQIKGHSICPCGSGQRLRKCHREKTAKLSEKIYPALAKLMLTRLGSDKKSGAV